MHGLAHREDVFRVMLERGAHHEHIGTTIAQSPGCQHIRDATTDDDRYIHL